MAGLKQEKVPIYDQAAEACVIGSAIEDSSCVSAIDLDPEDFFVDSHGLLWDAILALRSRGAEISQASMRIEVGSKVKAWAVDEVLAEALPAEAPYRAEVVKEKSRQRKLAAALGKMDTELRKEKLSSRQAVDNLMLLVTTLSFPSNKSRTITFNDPRIVDSHPPTYELTVSTLDGKVSGRIKVTSGEMDKPLVFRRKVREHLKINPILPKQFDAFVHQVLQQAHILPGPADTPEENICFWVREWFSAASEASTKDELSKGYLDREGAYWFSMERMLTFIEECTKQRIDHPQLWSALHSRGGRPTKIWRVGGKRVRLWGIDKSFFEEEEPAEREQIGLRLEDDDLKWLEE